MSGRGSGRENLRREEGEKETGVGGGKAEGGRGDGKKR